MASLPNYLIHVAGYSHSTGAARPGAGSLKFEGTVSMYPDGTKSRLSGQGYRPSSAFIQVPDDFEIIACQPSASEERTGT